MDSLKTFSRVKKQFHLKTVKGRLFPTIIPIAPSAWLVKLENQLITLERELIYINEVPKLLSLFQAIVDAF